MLRLRFVVLFVVKLLVVVGVFVFVWLISFVVGVWCLLLRLFLCYLMF